MGLGRWFHVRAGLVYGFIRFGNEGRLFEEFSDEIREHASKLVLKQPGGPFKSYPSMISIRMMC